MSQPRNDPWWEKLQLKYRRQRALAAAAPSVLHFAMMGGGELLISPDPSKPGRWRVTRLEVLEGVLTPTGHCEAATYQQAIEEAGYFTDYRECPCQGAACEYFREVA